MTTSANSKLLPTTGTFLINGAAARYQIKFGDEFAAEEGFYKLKGGGSHVLVLDGGPAAALGLLEAAKADILAMAASHSIPVRGGKSFAYAEGYYILLGVVTGQTIRNAIVFITEEGQVHQHYKANELEGEAVRYFFDDLGISRFTIGFTSFLELFLDNQRLINPKVIEHVS